MFLGYEVLVLNSRQFTLEGNFFEAKDEKNDPKGENVDLWADRKVGV